MAASQFQGAQSSHNKDGIESKSNEALTLECEQVMKVTNPDLHEGQISFTHGFVPYTPLTDELPPEFKAWDELAKNLSTDIGNVFERTRIQQLPLLDASNPATLRDKDLNRASTILGNAAHAYYYNQRLGHDQKADPLPENIRRPWEQVSARLKRKLPRYSEGKLKAIRGSYEAFFGQVVVPNNPALVDGVHNALITLDDLSMHMPLFNNNEERVFVLTIMLMELRFAPALKAIMLAIKAVALKDDEALIKALKTITQVIESISAALDYLTSNEHSKNYVDPTIWSRTIATFDGEIPGGLPGLSASVFPLFHTLDRFIERQEYDTVLGKAIVGKFEAQPQHIFDFLTALSNDLSRFSLKAYVEQSQNQLLKGQYQAMMDAYVGERGLLNVHAVKAYGVLKINFRSGRLETNGGQRGTATIEREEQRTTMDNFGKADAERRKGYAQSPYYATKVRVKMLSETATEVVLDVSKTSLDFLPGDHCAVLPVNADDEINVLVQEHKINLEVEINLNAEWKQFFFTKLGLDVASVKFKELLRYVDIRHSEFSDALNIHSLHPLTSRLYSVSPFAKLPGHIRLTVGTHSYVDGKNNVVLGKASGYLVHTASAIHVERAPARQFYLPQNSKTPILMFAAGTGISPFMGFLEARAQSKGLNWLFVSARKHSSLYYEDELLKAVSNDKLRLSVVFSREQDNALEFDRNNNCFRHKKKYAGNHVDELIKENAKEIAGLIRAGAHVYVCGNNEFEVTVRQSIKSALLANRDNEAKDFNEAACEKEMLRLMADHFYHYDAFTPAGSELSKPHRKIFRSEVAYHNQLEDCWMIINGFVYNLTRAVSKFIEIHPGGKKILAINAGMEASGDYNYAKHRESPQIEAHLAQNKVGELATVVFPDKKSAAIYNKCIKLLEGLLEMANTLSNGTTFTTKVPIYVWREVFSILAEGHLNNYESRGSVGSLKYVLGTLLNSFNEELGIPVDQYRKQLEPLFKQASECAEIIRLSTLKPSPEIHAQIEKINAALLEQTIRFINEIKLAVIAFANKLELHVDDPKTTSDLINRIETCLAEYFDVLKKARASLSPFSGNSSSKLPFFHPAVPAGGVCPMGFGRAKPAEAAQIVELKQEESALVAHSDFSIPDLPDLVPDLGEGLKIALSQLSATLFGCKRRQEQPNVERNDVKEILRPAT